MQKMIRLSPYCGTPYTFRFEADSAPLLRPAATHTDPAPQAVPLHVIAAFPPSQVPVHMLRRYPYDPHLPNTKAPSGQIRCGHPHIPALVLWFLAGTRNDVGQEASVRHHLPASGLPDVHPGTYFLVSIPRPPYWVGRDDGHTPPGQKRR